ncbi:MAG: pentapeptide repeat-containing protein [Proteobacteria bacterium]|nr:pentapeptide repeat-containing protein [Pseudomonadota bacterium]
MEKPREWVEWQSGVPNDWRFPFYRIEWCLRLIASWLTTSGLFRLLELGGRLTVVVAVLVFVLECDDRKKAKHYEAWRILATAGGREGDFGRRYALEDLNEDGVSLREIRLEGALLSRLQAPGVDLRDAMLTRANLEVANLQKSRLWRAHLFEARLRRATLDQADLYEAVLGHADLIRASARGARFERAELYNANLADADLTNANLVSANLRGADLRRAIASGAQFDGAALKGAMLWRTDLRGATGLTCEQLREAESWQSACRDEELRCGKGSWPPPCP